MARDWPTRATPEPANDYERRGPLGQRQIRLTEPQIAELAARYADGATVYELAKEFACNRTTVASRLKAYGVEMRYRPASDDDVKQFVELYGSGLSLAKVAEATGFSSKAIMTYLRRAGITLRDTHGRER